MKKFSIFTLAILLILSGCASSTPNDPADNGTEIDDGTPSPESTSTNIQTDKLDSALITRRSLSSDYVLIGEISQTAANRTAQMKNESIIQSYRRTYRITSESGGPLLITTGVTEYETPTVAKQAVERVTSDSADLDQNVEEATVSNDLDYYHISSQPDTGSYVSTAVYRGESVVFRAQTIDPNREYDDRSKRLLSEMITSVRDE